MSPALSRYGILAIRILLTLAFLPAGAFKLLGDEMMIGIFDAVGLGQWFRYATGLIEVGAAILLWVPGMQIVGAGLLVCTMIGAIIAHLFALGMDTGLPAIVLLILSGILLVHHRRSSAA